MRNVLVLLAVFGTVTSVATPCHAITINLTEASVGSSLQGFTVVAPNTNCLFPSTGNFRNVIRAAANYWQTIYTLPYTINVTWGFVDLPADKGGGSTGTHLQQSGAGAGIIDAGVLLINRNPNGCWYVDGNAATWAEYPGTVTSESIPYYNKPGRRVEVGRYTADATTGNASHADLFTTVLHELGHLLGMSSSTWRYTSEVTDGDIDVVTWHVNPGLSWMSSGAHLTFSGNPNMLMFPTNYIGSRGWPSQADISTISQLSGWWTTSWGTGGGGVQGVAANNPVNQ